MKKRFFTALQYLTFNYYSLRNAKNSLLILMFHQVSDTQRQFYPAMPTKVFADLCSYVKKYYEVIHVSEIANHFNKSTRPAAIITFDDGHYDILQNAWPVLSKLNLKFTINIDTEILETGKPQDFIRVFDILNNSNLDSYFDEQFMKEAIQIRRDHPLQAEAQFVDILSKIPSSDKRAFVEKMSAATAMPEEAYSKMLSTEDLQFLSSKGVEFGSHSHTHPILTEIPASQVTFELQHSKKILENLTQKPIDILAYPNGIWNESIEKIALDLGYKYFLLTEDKINHITPEILSKNRYTRVNQYHHSLAEALAHTYGMTGFLRKLLGR